MSLPPNVKAAWDAMIANIYRNVEQMIDERLRRELGGAVRGGQVTAASIVGSLLTVKEQDGTPTVSGVKEIRVSNGTLTNEGNGAVSIATGGGGGGTTATILAVIDGGGAAITTGVKLDVRVDFAATIVGWRLYADQAGDIVLDIWKDVHASFPPDAADSITASAKPTLSAADHAEDTTLTGWTTAISAGDVLRFNVDSASTVQRVTLALEVERT